MFLLRTAFWLTIVLVLLPGVPKSGPDATEKVNPVEALSAATATVADAGGFCGRQPQACAVGAQLFEAAGERAREGALMVFEFVSQKISEQKRAAAVHGGKGVDTLTKGDLGAEWRGPSEPDDGHAPPDAGHVPVPPKRPA